MKGDLHNFGHQVRKRGSWIEKPRPVYWEWLFLCPNSPLRSYFNSIENDPFEAYPHAKVEFFDIGLMPYSGRIEFFHFEKQFNTSESNLNLLGKTLGTALFFGLNDLHFDNLGYFKSQGKQYIFPFDIETVFNQIDLLSQTYLVSAKRIDSDLIGLKNIVKGDTNVAAIIDGFILSIRTLNSNRSSILDVLKKLPLEKVPIRQLIRDTDDYIESLNSQNFAGFYKEEIEQLERGDIPYFCTFLNSQKLWQLTHQGLKPTKISYGSIYEKLLKPLSADPVEAVSEDSLKTSSLQIARTFALSDNQFFSYKNVNVQYRHDDVLVDCGNDWKIRCKKLS